MLVHQDLHAFRNRTDVTGREQRLALGRVNVGWVSKPDALDTDAALG